MVVVVLGVVVVIVVAWVMMIVFVSPLRALASGGSERLHSIPMDDSLLIHDVPTR